MPEISSLTRDAVKALGRYVASSAGRKLFAANGYTDETTIVAAHESELVGVTMDRAIQHEPPVVLAVHYPSRDGSESFTFVQIEPVDTPRPQRDQVGKSSTIGMFADSLSGRGTVTCDFSSWHESVRLHSFEPALA